MQWVLWLCSLWCCVCSMQWALWFCSLWCCVCPVPVFVLRVVSSVFLVSSLLYCGCVSDTVLVCPPFLPFLCCSCTCCLRALAALITPFLMDSHASIPIFFRFCRVVQVRCALPEQSQRPPDPPFTNPPGSPSFSIAVSAGSMQTLLSSPPRNLPV